MSDGFYRFVCLLGRPVFRACSRPVVLHPERGAADGGFLLAGTHFSPYDVACLMHTTRRHIDFVSIRELMSKPLVGWFFSALNAMPLDRGRVDSKTVRAIVDRLRSGRVVGIFPEGSIRTPENSILAGGKMRSGIGRMAIVAGVPIVPCVILDTGNFSRPGSWAPIRRTRFAVAYGEPIHPPDHLEDKEARQWLEKRWRESVLELHAELKRSYPSPGQR